MLWKNRNKKVGLCVMVVTSFFILVALWTILAMPETALAKKPGGGGGKETRTYRVTFQDDIGTVAASGCRTMSIINPEDSVAHLLFNIVAPLDLSGVIGGVLDFDTCFPGGAKDDGMHGLFRDKQDPTKVNGTLFFPGLDKGGKEIGYRLDYTGTVIAGTWTPPEIDEGNNVATIGLDTWELKADTGGRKNACSGEGIFSGSSITTILVERISACP
ncbi:MAG TPA: hypothetical protein DIU00_04910 [Phycisphaerales bacterium]|nr:hypothetical protein [Phycisphaerales bacterium]